MMEAGLIDHATVLCGVRKKTTLGICSFWHVLVHWQHRYKERKQLALIDVRLLNDMGITRHEAEIEASKPFWQP